MEDTPGDPNIPNELATAAEAIKRERLHILPKLLEGLAMAEEADIKSNWPDAITDPFKPDDRKVIPREWASVSVLRARAALFREAADIIRYGFRVPAEMLPKEDAASAATEMEERGREMRAALIADGWPTDKIGTVYPVKRRKRDHDLL